MTKYFFILDFLSYCNFDELLDLRQIICQEIEKRQEAIKHRSAEIETEETNSDDSNGIDNFQPQDEEKNFDVKLESSLLFQEEPSEIGPLIVTEEPKISNNYEMVQIQTEMNTKLDHEKLNAEVKPFKCQFCNRGFAQKSQKIRHERVHTGERPFGCQFCEKKFFTKGEVTSHERVHTREKPYKRQPKKSPSNAGELKIPEIDLAEIEQKKTRPSGTSNGTQARKRFKCKFCKLTFRTEIRTFHHERTHTEERRFKCQFCESKFLTMNRRIDHEKIHAEVKPFKCQFCNRSFAQKNQKIKHERVHTGEKPFGCQFCDKKFSSKGEVTRHERFHTGEKPYKCQFCDLTFAQSCNKTVHERFHHTRGKPFECKFCQKKFAQEEDACVHERIHIEEADQMSILE